MQRAATILVILHFGFLSGCQPLTRVRFEQTIRTDGRQATLGLWTAGLPLLPPYDPVSPLACYPLDVWASTVVAVQAPFHPDCDIRWGPLGALAGIVLPGVTLMCSAWVSPPVEAWLAPEDFDRLVESIRTGNPVATYRAVMGDDTWDRAADSLVEVELLSLGSTDER